MILWFHLLVLHRAYQEEIENQVHSRYRKKHRSEQDSYERYVRQRRIPRHSLLSVERLTADAGLNDMDEIMADLAIKREATSMRQSAEWGMGTVQASFPRLKDTFTYEEYGERKITLTCLFLLYNCRARLVGINQIKNVYLPYLEADANLQYVPTNN